jgi:hypothetical protein
MAVRSVKWLMRSLLASWQQHDRSGRLGPEMKRLQVLALVAMTLLAACSSTPPPSVTAPTSSDATPSPITTPSASPTVVPAATVSCRPATFADIPGLEADTCPEAIAAVRTLFDATVEQIARIYLEPDGFDCGVFWPGASTPAVCPMPSILPASGMHGWVSFFDTDRVAAVGLSRQVPSDGGAQTVGPWQAEINAFEVPPAGFVMP